MTAEQRHRRGRKATFMLVMGAIGAGATWLAGQLSPGEMLCIEQKTLLAVGVATGAGAGVAGEVISRIPKGWVNIGLELLTRVLKRR